MEEGIIVDQGVAGLPVVSPQIWTLGIKWGGLSTKETKVVKVFHCQSCGFLESYAK